jgi:trehalose 6-phosphate phosphatase
MLHVQTEDFPVESKKKLSDFFAASSRADSRALLVDYDGTLAPFCTDRNRTPPYPEVPPLLNRIKNSTDTRLVVVTGRRACEIGPLLDLKRVEVWGCHGLERLRTDGTFEMPRLPEPTLQALAEADEMLAVEGLADLIEYKPAGTAIHWRGLEALADEVTGKVQRVWSMLPEREGLSLVEFNGGIEMRVTARNKGDAVRTILSEMKPGTSVAYMGDDVTDEDAFSALQGRGLSILVQDEYRPTAADVWIRPPEEVVAFLEQWVTACGGAS